VFLKVFNSLEIKSNTCFLLLVPPLLVVLSPQSDDTQISNPQSAIGYWVNGYCPQSAIGYWLLVIGLMVVVRNPQSAIRNP
jgi:hypothetical protein